MGSAEKGTHSGAMLIRALIYVLVVTAPLVLVVLFRRETDHGFVFELGKSLALVAYAVLAMQFVVAARLKWIEEPFGLDMLFRFHRAMAIFAALLLLLHPVLLAVGGAGPRLLTSFDAPWYILLGKLALTFLVLMALVAMFRAAIRLDFEKWRIGHNSAALVVLGVGSLHAWYAAGDVRLPPMHYAWIAILGLALVAYAYSRIWEPRRARQQAYDVAEVRRETHNVWTLSLAPPEGRRPLAHLPGQFGFLTLYRGPGLPVEEHPFTFASDPTQADALAFTIKESGDFTSTIGSTKPGDKAAVRGPYGRFSYALGPGEEDLVFIAGGVGMTPFISMLRHMRSIDARHRVLLLYGNRTEKDILFREELEQMEAAAHPPLTVVHVLSEPDAPWDGETGYLDPEKLQRLCGADLSDKSFYICGPPPMSESVLRALRAIGVPAWHLHHEHFAL